MGIDIQCRTQKSGQNQKLIFYLKSASKYNACNSGVEIKSFRPGFLCVPAVTAICHGRSPAVGIDMFPEP